MNVRPFDLGVLASLSYDDDGSCFDLITKSHPTVASLACLRLMDAGLLTEHGRLTRAGEERLNVVHMKFGRAHRPRASSRA